MSAMKKITPCLWFDSEAEDAASYYVSIFPNSRIGEISRFGEAGQEIHHKPVGSVMAVEFELDGNPFVGLNGGPMFKFSEATSFQIFCETQEEVDHYWNHLTKGGDADAQQCGWLKDKFGVSWQVIPNVLIELLKDPDAAKSQRVANAMLQMKRMDIAGLQRAAELAT